MILHKQVCKPLVGSSVILRFPFLYFWQISNANRIAQLSLELSWEAAITERSNYHSLWKTDFHKLEYIQPLCIFVGKNIRI